MAKAEVVKEWRKLGCRCAVLWNEEAGWRWVCSGWGDGDGDWCSGFDAGVRWAESLAGELLAEWLLSRVVGRKLAWRLVQAWACLRPGARRYVKLNAEEAA